MGTGEAAQILIKPNNRSSQSPFSSARLQTEKLYSYNYEKITQNSTAIEISKKVRTKNDTYWQSLSNSSFSTAAYENSDDRCSISNGSAHLVNSSVPHSFPIWAPTNWTTAIKTGVRKENKWKWNKKVSSFLCWIAYFKESAFSHSFQKFFSFSNSSYSYAIELFGKYCQRALYWHFVLLRLCE